MYCLQFQQFIYRGQKPFKIIASGHLNKYETDESTSAVLFYPGGKTAVLTTSAVAQHPNEGYVVGTKGILRVRISVCSLVGFFNQNLCNCKDSKFLEARRNNNPNEN